MGFKKIIKTTIIEYLNESEFDIDKNSKIISSIDGIKIRIIDSEIVSKIFPVWENYLGSHHYGKKSSHIPENEVWISNKVPEKNLDKIQVQAALLAKQDEINRLGVNATDQQKLQLANDLTRLSIKQTMSQLEDAIGLYKHPVVKMSNNPELLAGVFGDINEANYGVKARPLAENAFRAMLGDEKYRNRTGGRTCGPRRRFD